MRNVSILIAIVMPILFSNYAWAAKSCMEGRTAGALSVAKKNVKADFTSIQSAIDCASGIVYNSSPASSTNPYVIRVMSGIYKESIHMKPHVDVVGSGQENTKITSSAVFTVFGADNSTIKNIWVDSTGATESGRYHPSAILSDNTSMTINKVKVTINNPVPPLMQAYGIQILGASSKPLISNCTVYAKGINQRGLIGIGGENSSFAINDCVITVDTSGASYSFWNVGIQAKGGSATVKNSVLKVKGADYNRGIEYVKNVTGSRVESIATSNTISNIAAYYSKVTNSEIITKGTAKKTNCAVYASRVKKSLIDGPICGKADKIVNSWDANNNPVPNQ